MTLLLATLPEERIELAQTLERYLIGPELDDLVGELLALHGESEPMSIAQLLNNDRRNLLARGLASLPAEKVRQLLRNPKLLTELQELVLIEGGPYWDQLLQQQSEVQGIVERVGRRLQVSLGLANAPTPARPKVPATRFYARPGFVSLATAAVVLVAVYYGFRYWESQRNWGWNRPDLLAKATTDKEVFRILADAGHEFGQHVKNSPENLDRALCEMKEGCIRLRSARYPQLSKKDYDWLQEKCKDWGEKLDQHLVDLRSGSKDWKTVREEANQTVETLVTKLRDRTV